MTTPTVRAGIDRLLANPAILAGKRIGFLGHAASVSGDLRPVWPLLAADRRFSLIRLFGPEHGLGGTAQDMEGVDSAHDVATGLPVVSLYGRTEESLSPKPEHLDRIDAIVIDLVDVGSRYYTFLATLGLVIRAAASARVAVIVCDRPNPLGGELVEGPRLIPGLRSFVGMFDLPVVHGLTPGEFARWVVAREALDVELEVITMDGWRRGMRWPETGLPFVPPSPNMPTYETALVYPGSCLVEATNLSEGRGTTRPFEQNGAPFIDGIALAERLSRRDLPGVIFRPAVFKPTFHKWSNRDCHGVFSHVIDPGRFRPFRTGCALLVESSRFDGFAWRADTYEFIEAGQHPAIDLLTGSLELRQRIDAARDLDDWPTAWERDESSWREEREPYLLYRSERPASISVPPFATDGSALNETPGSPPLLAFVGRHDSGKTTLVVRLVERLTSRGIRVGTIKHTPHPVEMDRPGKDSRRHSEAGAIRVALVTPDAIQLRESLVSPQSLRDVVARHFPAGSVDAILVEGYKTEDLPKIEVIRSSISIEPMRKDDPFLVAIATDVNIDSTVPRFSLDDLDGIERIVLETMGLAPKTLGTPKLQT